MSAPDLQGWWKAFGIPELNALVEQALSQNLPLAQARSRLRQARLLEARDKAQFLPTLSFGITTVQDVAAVDTFLHVGLDATWELGLFGARQAVERGGQARVDQAAAAAQAAKVTLVAEVVRHYLALQAARENESLRIQQVALDARVLQLHDLRRAAHLGTMDDRHVAEQRRADARAQLASPRASAAQARQSLAVLLTSFTPDAQWANEPAPPVLRLRPFRLEQVPTDLLRYRPDIANAQADVTQALSDLGKARAAQYPRVVLGLSYLYARNITKNSGVEMGDSPSLGPLVDIPLFDWGRRQAATDARQEALESSLLGYRQALVVAVGETESALSVLAEAFERASQLDLAQKLADRQVALQRTRMRLGLASDIERLDAERAMLQARMEFANAKWDCAQAVVVLYKSLGGAPLPKRTNALPETIGMGP